MTFDLSGSKRNQRGSLLRASYTSRMRPCSLPRSIPAGHIVARQVACQPLPQLVGLARIEALADERAQVVAQRLCQLLFGYARDVCVLNNVPLVDIEVVVSQGVALGLLLPTHDEEHPRLSVGVHDAAHSDDVAGPLGFDARAEFVEALLAERSACERTESPVEGRDSGDPYRSRSPARR